MFITTSTFSKGAREFAGMIESKIVLIDGDELGDPIIDYDLGVGTVVNYAVKQLDMDYFEG